MQIIDKRNLRILRKIVAKEGKATVRLDYFNRSKAGFDPDFQQEEILWLKSSKLASYSSEVGENTAEGYLSEYATIKATPEGHALVEERKRESVQNFWHKTYPTIVSTLALLLSALAFLFSRGWLR